MPPIDSRSQPSPPHPNHNSQPARAHPPTHLLLAGLDADQAAARWQVARYARRAVPHERPQLKRQRGALLGNQALQDCALFGAAAAPGVARQVGRLARCGMHWGGGVPPPLAHNAQQQPRPIATAPAPLGLHAGRYALNRPVHGIESCKGVDGRQHRVDVAGPRLGPQEGQDVAGRHIGEAGIDVCCFRCCRCRAQRQAPGRRRRRRQRRSCLPPAHRFGLRLPRCCVTSSRSTAASLLPTPASRSGCAYRSTGTLHTNGAAHAAGRFEGRRLRNVPAESGRWRR